MNPDKPPSGTGGLIYSLVGVLGRDNIRINSNSGLREQLTQRTKLLILLGIGRFLPKLRRGFCGNGSAVSNKENRAVLGFWAETVGTLEFVENGKRVREEMETTGMQLRKNEERKPLRG